MSAKEKFMSKCEELTNQIVADLEKGKVMWRCNYTAVGMPANVVTKKAYEGFNFLYLCYMMQEKGYKSPYFLTYNQAVSLGGNVKKGERGYQIIFWKRTFIALENGTETATNDEGVEVHGKTRFTPFLWTVFNVEQCENIKADKIPTVNVAERTISQSFDYCQSVVENMPNTPKIKHFLSGTPCYIPALDEVKVPERMAYDKDESYFATMFHELAHSTGHKSRLNRFQEENTSFAFASNSYSKEELVAEIAAAFLCLFCGIKDVTYTNSVAYLQSWIKALKNDKTMIVYAAQRAQKAASYILNI